MVVGVDVVVIVIFVVVLDVVVGAASDEVHVWVVVYTDYVARLFSLL